MKNRRQTSIRTQLQSQNVESPNIPTTSNQTNNAITSNEEAESIQDIMRGWLPRGPYQFLLMLLALIGSGVSLYRGDTQTFLFILGIVAAGCGIPTINNAINHFSKPTDKKQPDND